MIAYMNVLIELGAMSVFKCYWLPHVLLVNFSEETSLLIVVRLAAQIDCLLSAIDKINFQKVHICLHNTFFKWFVSHHFRSIPYKNIWRSIKAYTVLTYTWATNGWHECRITQNCFYHIYFANIVGRKLYLHMVQKCVCAI